MAPTGHGLLPDNVPYDSSFDVFSLFFDENTLAILVKHTDEYAKLYPGPNSADARP